MFEKILTEAAAGRFPAPDGSVTVLPQPSDRDAGILAMTAHAVVFCDEDPAWIRRTVADAPIDPLAAPLSPYVQIALARRTGRHLGNIDLLTVADRLPGPPPLPLSEITDREHPRVVRALTYRDQVRVWAADDGLLVLGRGVAGRWEAAVEVEPDARHAGLGRALALAARHLVPDGDLVWAQQSPGNARSVRAFQAAGYRPIGAELLMVRHPIA